MSNTTDDIDDADMQKFKLRGKRLHQLLESHFVFDDNPDMITFLINFAGAEALSVYEPPDEAGNREANAREYVTELVNSFAECLVQNCNMAYGTKLVFVPTSQVDVTH